MATPAPVASTTVADTSAFGGPNAAQAAAANAALSNPSATATPVPTKAPTGQTSTSSAPASPTTVVSSQPAAQAVQQMGNTLTQAQIDLTNQQSIKAANAANEKAGLVPVGSGSSSTFITPQPPAAKTPEQQIADTPDTGNQWLYDTQGNKVQVAIGALVPPGYSTVNPGTGPTTAVADTTTDSVGNVYKQFSDGTYGKFNPLGAYVGPASAVDFGNSKSGEQILTSLNQVINGTYPLTANQQAQVDGIKAQFQSLITQQQTANANFTGATTVAENLYGMGTSLTGLGEIKGTVDAGIAKIADLNSKMTSAIAQMESGFQQDNLNMLKTAYDIYSNSAKLRQDEIDKLQAAADAKAKDMRDYQIQVQTLALTKMMDDNTISYQAKQLALSQSQLDQKTKDDIETQQLNRLKYQLDVQTENFKEKQANQAAAGASIGNGLPAVGYTASGAADPASQQAFLNSLPGGPNGDLATQIKGLANYTIDPTSFTVRTLKGGTQITRDQMVALATRYNPNYNQANYAAAAKYITSFKSTTPNSTGGNIAAVNTAINHFTDFVNNVTALNNGPVSATLNSGANKLKNATYGANYQGKYKGAQNDATALAEQLAKFYKGGGTADQQTTQRFIDMLDVNQTPGQLKGNVTSTVSLLVGQLDTAYSDYENAMGHPPPAPGQPGSILTPAAIASLKSLGVDASPYMGVQPYTNTTNEDLINAVPGNSQGTTVDTSSFFNNL